MEGHTERMKCENTYAHIFFDQIPDPTEKKFDTNIVSIDSLSDQSPLKTLRGGQEFTAQFRGLYGRLHLNLSETSACQSGKSLLGLREVSTRSESIPA